MAFASPRTLSHRSETYHQLAQMIAAGMGLIPALQSMSRQRGMGEYRQTFDAVIDKMQRGETLAEALETQRAFIPEFDVALIQASEESGRLDDCFRLLSDYYKEKASLARMLITQLFYPAVLFHALILIFPIHRFTDMVLKGEVLAWLLPKLCILIPIYALVWVVRWISAGNRALNVRAKLERVIHALPLLGKAQRSLALARHSVALESLLNAGVLVVQAWEMAAAASGSPRLERIVASWRHRLEAGETHSELLAEEPFFPDVFRDLYASGEISGKLDDTLRRLYNYYHEDGTRKVRICTHVFTKGVYFGVAAFVIFYVVTFWLNYYSAVLP